MDLLLGLILVLTAGFIGLLYGVVYIAYKRISNKDEYIEPEELADKTVNERLERHEKLVKEFMGAVDGR